MVSDSGGNCLRIILYSMIKIKSILLFLIVLISLQLQSQYSHVDLYMAKHFVSVFLTDNTQNRDVSFENVTVLFSDDIDVPDAYLFNLKPVGFVIISSTNKVSL